MNPISPDNKIRIAFVITGLGIGGAETMLLKLVSNIDRVIFEPFVISLTNHVPLAPHFEKIGITVHVIDMNRRLPDPRGFFRLCSLIRIIKPDLVNTWMYHADLIGGIAAKISCSVPVVWNIRHSNLDSATDKRMTLLTAKTCANISGILPSAIICCAEAAQKIHLAIGYAEEKFTIIPNGFNLTAFRSDIFARRQVRNEFNISEMSLVIGLVGRFHPQKDHRNFIKSTTLFLKQYPNTHFVLCGDNVDWDNQQLRTWISQTGNPHHYHLLGRRQDMPRINAAFDIACSSSSHGEAFSNTLGEAMSCAVPCVSTDVGGAAEVIGNTGFIVPPRDAEAFASALDKMAGLGTEGIRELGKRARERIHREYSLDKIVKEYEGLFLHVTDNFFSNKKGGSSVKDIGACRLR